MNKTLQHMLFRSLLILALLSLMVGVVSAQEKRVLRVASASEPRC